MPTALGPSAVSATYDLVKKQLLSMNSPLQLVRAFDRLSMEPMLSSNGVNTFLNDDRCLASGRFDIDGQSWNATRWEVTDVQDIERLVEAGLPNFVISPPSKKRMSLYEQVLVFSP